VTLRVCAGIGRVTRGGPVALQHCVRDPPIDDEVDAAEERIRLRVALHAGEIYPDDHGFAGASINLTFRLIDSTPLRNALAGSPGVLAMVVSSWFFDEVVRHCAGAHSESYRQLPVDVKETSTTGWICLPDQPLAIEAPGRYLLASRRNVEDL
jgi:hypothetical protein